MAATLAPGPGAGSAGRSFPGALAAAGAGRWALRLGERTRRRGDPRAGGKVRPPRGPGAARVFVRVAGRRGGAAWVRRVRRALVGPRAGLRPHVGGVAPRGSHGSVRSSVRPSRLCQVAATAQPSLRPRCPVTRGFLPSCISICWVAGLRTPSMCPRGDFSKFT